MQAAATVVYFNLAYIIITDTAVANYGGGSVLPEPSTRLILPHGN